MTALTRLALLKGSAALAVATTAIQSLNGPDFPDTPVWCYDGRVPGSEIRVPQGG